MKLPYDEKSEAALLGGILLDPLTVMELVYRENITVEHFFDGQNKQVFNSIMRFCQKNKTAELDVLSLASFDKRLSTNKLNQLIEIVVSAVYSEYHLRQVKGLWLKRDIIKKAYKAIDIASSSDSGTEALNEVQAMFFNITRPNNELNPKNIWNSVNKRWTAAEDGVLPGIPSPFPKFDAATGGVQFGVSTALAGTADSRKSYLLANWALHLGKCNIPGCYMPFEDGNEITLGRMVTILANSSAYRLTIGRGHNRELERTQSFSDEVIAMPIGWYGKRGIGTEEIEAIVARGVAKHKWQWLFIDGFKDIKRKYNNNRLDEDDRKSNALADLAQRYNIALISIHHITKSGGRAQTKEDEPLIIQDLKGSGGIIDDCRMVIFMQKFIDGFALDVQKNNYGRKGYVELQMEDESVGAFIEKPMTL